MVDVAVFENDVWKRLTAPAETITFEELALRWNSVDISVRIEGYGVLADHEQLLSDLRGSFGRGLMAGASERSLAEQVCDWSPPCANDVFFGPKPEVKVTRHHHAIPKPFILRAEADGPDLVLTISLFGFASQWLGDVRAAMLGAVRERMEWRRLAGGRFLPRDLVVSLRQHQISAVAAGEQAPADCVMRFITPVDCKNTDPLDRPVSILSRLASRLYLMARWQDVAIEVDWRQISAAWRALEINVIKQERHKITRDSGRTSTRFFIPGRLLDVELSGNLQAVWPLLKLGEVVHVGRGTVAGLGRYKLD